jgi:hypothetical protein
LRHYVRLLLLCLAQLMLVIQSVVYVALRDVKVAVGFCATALT